MIRPMAKDALAFWYFVRDGEDNQERLVVLVTTGRRTYRRPRWLALLKTLDNKRRQA